MDKLKIPLKEFHAKNYLSTEKKVVTVTQAPHTPILTLVMGPHECNMNPIQVRYLAALRPALPSFQHTSIIYG